jgi:hypothetical protein
MKSEALELKSQQSMHLQQVAAVLIWFLSPSCCRVQLETVTMKSKALKLTSQPHAPKLAICSTIPAKSFLLISSLSSPCDRVCSCRLQVETAAMKAEALKLKSQPHVFQSSRCAASGQALELPVVHFMCGHSFNLRSLGESDRCGMFCFRSQC